MQYYNANTVIYLNGAFVKASAAQTDLYGQSLHYGLAAFEGIRAYKTHNATRIFKAKEHFDRLKKSCELVVEYAKKHHGYNGISPVRYLLHKKA